MRRALAVLATAAIGISACTDSPLPSAPDAAATTPPSFAVATPAEQVEPFVAGRVLARFRPGAPAAQTAAAQDAAIEREVTPGILMLSVPAGRELQVAQALSRNPNVEFAELDYLRTFGQPSVMLVNDPFIGYKWDLDNDGKIQQHRIRSRHHGQGGCRHGRATR